jgi:hypothetical protein
MFHCRTGLNAVMIDPPFSNYQITDKIKAVNVRSARPSNAGPSSLK